MASFTSSPGSPMTCTAAGDAWQPRAQVTHVS